MKRKFFILLLAIISCFSCAVALSACDDKKPENGSESGTVQTPPGNETPSGDEEPSVTPHEHETTLIPAKQADCETAGNIEYYTCTCGRWFKDANATTEITDKSTVTVKATGHSYSAEWTSDGTQHWHKATCIHTSLTSEKQEHNFENSVCTVCNYVEDLLTFKTLEVDDDSVYGKVSNATSEFSFIKEVTANKNTSYTVCTDKACKDAIPSKTVDLKFGDNVFYVLAECGNDVKLYTVTIRRRPIHTVTFDTAGGTAVASLYLEEDETITEPITSKTGYTFVNWTVGDEAVTFPYTVTKAVTVKANFVTTEYKILFNTNGGTLNTTKDSYNIEQAVTLDNPAKDYYDFAGWYDNADFSGSAVVNIGIGNYGDKTFYAKWQYGTAGLQYALIDEEYKVNGYTGVSPEVIIPSEFNGYPVTSIGYMAFNGCTSLTSASITIGDGVTLIGIDAFRGCSGLEKVNITDLTAWCNIKFNNEFATPLLYARNLYISDELITQLTITDSVTSIGDAAFFGCDSLTSIIIPDAVTSIGATAFYGCSGLTSITIPDGVTTIYAVTFDGCYQLTEIHYNGTKEQWEKISKQSNWNVNVGDYTVYCTDGNILKADDK